MDASRQRSVGVPSGFHLEPSAYQLQFGATGLAERPQRVGARGVRKLMHLVDGQVAREVLVGDARQQVLCLGEHGLRSGEADAVGQRIKGKQLFRIVERMRERVDQELRAFADEFACLLYTSDAADE